MNEPVSLQAFEPSSLELLARWMTSPPVARWYPEPANNLKWASQPPEGGAHAIIAISSLEVGYIRWQRVSRDALDSVGLREIPDNSVDIDILIGEESCIGKGIGTSALLQLTQRLRIEGDVPLAGISPEPGNAMAIRSYEKAGFRFRRNYSIDAEGPAYSLMTLDLWP